MWLLKKSSQVHFIYKAQYLSEPMTADILMRGNGAGRALPRKPQHDNRKWEIKYKEPPPPSLLTPQHNLDLVHPFRRLLGTVGSELGGQDAGVVRPSPRSEVRLNANLIFEAFVSSNKEGRKGGNVFFLPHIGVTATRFS